MKIKTKIRRSPLLAVLLSAAIFQSIRGTWQDPLFATNQTCALYAIAAGMFAIAMAIDFNNRSNDSE